MCEYRLLSLYLEMYFLILNNHHRLTFIVISNLPTWMSALLYWKLIIHPCVKSSVGTCLLKWWVHIAEDKVIGGETHPPPWFTMLLLAVGTNTGSISAKGLWGILLFKQEESGWQSSMWLLDASRPPFKNAVCSQTRRTEEASVVFSWMENIVVRFAVGGDPVEIWVVQHVCKWKKGMKSEVTADGSRFSS